MWQRMLAIHSVSFLSLFLTIKETLVFLLVHGSLATKYTFPRHPESCEVLSCDQVLVHGMRAVVRHASFRSCPVKRTGFPSILYFFTSFSNGWNASIIVTAILDYAEACSKLAFYLAVFHLLIFEYQWSCTSFFIYLLVIQTQYLTQWVEND